MVAAIYNVFDGIELLPYSINNIAPCVDGVIIVYQKVSNYGQVDDRTDDINLIAASVRKTCYVLPYTPNLSLQASENERNKREQGRKLAKTMGYTHFIDMDCDEFYLRDEFNALKDKIYKEKLNGAVVRSKVYFGSPELTIGEDITLVPFIHKIDCKHEFNRKYPYAFDKTIRIDPTRQLSYTDGVILEDIYMHHYSYVRKDIKKKIQNSTARSNIEKSNVLKDLVQAKEGYFCEFYNKYLTYSPNVFGLPIWQRNNNQDIGTISEGNL